MVGNFNEIPGFDPETQILQLKPEYTSEIRNMSGQLLVIFDPTTVEPELYPYYFYNGLNTIFDIVDKI